MRELVERTIEDAPAAAECGELRRIAGGVLAARGHVSARQLEAGERLRGDYEMAALHPASRCGGTARRRHDPRRRTERLDPTLTQIAARRRFDER